MARPFYETQTDRDKEAQIGKVLADMWLVSITKMKPAYVIDYAIKKSGSVVAVMEIKCRSYSSEALERMGGLILSAHKVQAARQWRDTHGVSFVLALGLPDGVFAMSIKKDEEWPTFNVVISGRTDRGDAHDVEPCVLIPMNRFVKYA